MKKHVWLAIALAAALATPALAQVVDNSRGVDPRVDYASMTKIGPWDDRNYDLTKEDLTWLASNEAELKDPIPVFFRVLMRQENKNLERTGPAQYPRSALQVFQIRYKGYLIDGKLYRKVSWRDDRFRVGIDEIGISEQEFDQRALVGNVRITSPSEASESAIKINPVDSNKVVAGSNGPGAGQRMWYSADGGSTWTAAAGLPQGSTCCDPTVDWSSNGQYAYTATLGFCGGTCVWFYRSSDFGATWDDLATITPGDGRRELTSGGVSDKEFLHVDKFASSSFKDNVYMTWHDNNVLKFARSTDFGHSWSTPLTISGTSTKGIGSDITSDKNGNVYYFWPATSAKQILVRKSTNGGTSFNSSVVVSNTSASYEFPIPAMDSRRAFIYASADTDLTNGAYANRIYVAWTDTTGAESTTAANNHARIRVAYSSNGGASWTVTTPHETTNQNTVDRFHPWLAVGPDGKVYVIFYDTRNDSSRRGVDIYYSVSSTGGATWSTPTRVTSQISPQIDTANEWGDYNGLDVVGSQLISTFTDNRNESGGTTDSVDIYAAALPPLPPIPVYVTVIGPTSRTPNQSGTWTCDITGGVPPYNYSWFKTYTSGLTDLGTSSTQTTSHATSFNIICDVWDSVGTYGGHHVFVDVDGVYPLPY